MSAPKPLISLSFYLPVISLVIFLVILIVAFPLPVNPGLDFSQFYIDLFGILHGDPIYHQLSHASHFAESTLTRPVTLNPPAYPPWYYVLFLPLGLFDHTVSAQLWAWCNLGMFAGALLLLTERLSLRMRTCLIAACLCFTPLTGHIVVGQQTIILLLGLALTLKGTERQSSPLTAGGLLLLTFKPHLGLPIAAAIVCWLLLKHSPLAVSTLVRFFAGMTLLIILSLILDRHSLIDYPDSLQRLSALSLNQVCDTCSSLALTIQRSLDSGTEHLWSNRFVTSLFVGMFFGLPLFFVRLTDRAFISASVCVILLAAPYIRNYDYVLLLFPLVALTEEGLVKSRVRRIHSLIRESLCLLGFFFAGILPLIAPRESHQYFLWISAALVYGACFTGRQSRNIN